jgi:hypothetical protein
MQIVAYPRMLGEGIRIGPFTQVGVFGVDGGMWKPVIACNTEMFPFDYPCFAEMPTS